MTMYRSAAHAAAIAALCSAAAAAELPEVSDPSFTEFLPSFIEGTRRFMEGEATLWKAHAANAEDVVIMGARGAYEKGWDEEVSDRYDWAVARFRYSEADLRIEYLNAMTSGDLAFTTAIEHATVELAGRAEATPMTLRATQVVHKENSHWKLIQRPADPLIAHTTVETVINR